jgi:hypothetical protein
MPSSRPCARQAQASIDVVNDGEFGKSGWANYCLERLRGFAPRPDKLYPTIRLGRDRIRFAEFMAAEFQLGTVGTPGHEPLLGVSRCPGIPEDFSAIPLSEYILKV